MNKPNDTIQTLLNHRSIRLYENRPLTDEQIQWIVQSAQAAATSSFVQAYSIIGISDQQKKTKLAELAGNQPYVAENGHLFIFCLDLHRNELAAEMEQIPADEIEVTLNSSETFIVGTVDATLAAQNAVIAAESMGLGTVYIGGLRNNLPEVTALLGIPDRVVPLFGLVVGYPADPSDLKPRLPLRSVYHKEEYLHDDEAMSLLHQYNKQISTYYAERTGGQRQDRWTEIIARQLKSPKRLYMKQFLKTQRLPLE